MSKHKHGKNNTQNQPKQDNSPHIPQRDKLKQSLTIRELNWTDKQKQIISTILDKDTRMVFISGPSGVSKTLLAVYCGLKLLDNKKYWEFNYVRTAVESSSKSLGYLSGEKSQKMEPYVEPLIEKLHELLPNSEVNALVEDGRIKGDVVNYLRGRQMEAYNCADEAQNFTYSEITTFITRAGKFAKTLILGDPMQADLQGKSGFKTMFDIFNDDESKANGIYCFEFTREDVMRSGTVKFILEKLEKHKSEKLKEPMFS